MSIPNPPAFRGGPNIAMKLPPKDFERTLVFYRDILRLPLLEIHPNSVLFELGPIRLWLDRVEGRERTEIWLEVQTDDTRAAAIYLNKQDVPRCDKVEKLPEGLDGFWITNPAGIVHRVAHEES